MKQKNEILFYEIYFIVIHGLNILEVYNLYLKIGSNFYTLFVTIKGDYLMTKLPINPGIKL